MKHEHLELTEAKPEDYLLPTRWQSLAIPLAVVGVVLVVLSYILLAAFSEKAFATFAHSYLPTSCTS